MVTKQAKPNRQAGAARHLRERAVLTSAMGTIIFSDMFLYVFLEFILSSDLFLIRFSGDLRRRFCSLLPSARGQIIFPSQSGTMGQKETSLCPYISFEIASCQPAIFLSLTSAPIFGV